MSSEASPDTHLYTEENERCFCDSLMEAKDELLAGPFYMCESCWKDYWKAVAG